MLADNEIVLHGSNPRWLKFTPTRRRNKRAPVRACIWAAKQVTATQLPVDSADITAIAIRLDQRRIIVVSVYIPAYNTRKTKEENRIKLETRLNLINQLAQEELLRNPHVELLIAGDFNRHNSL